MNPEEQQQVSDGLEKVVSDTIERVVNGKINRLTLQVEEIKKLNLEQNKKIEEHRIEMQRNMNIIRPYIEGVTGVKMLGRLITWAGGIAVAWLAIKGFLIK